MKIIIATGIYPPDIGGPAEYARGVEEAWKKAGHVVKVLAFRFERKLPTGIRHLYYFFRVLFALRGADFVFSPDTFSAALPAFLATKLFGKRIIIRTGGDFLWEQYMERTGDLILLRYFYGNTNYEQDTKLRKENNWQKKLNLKEQIIFRFVRFLFRHADATVFSTAWQRDIFEKPYRLDLRKCFIVENYYATPMTRIHPNIPNADATQKTQTHQNISNKKEIVEKELSYKLGGVFFEVQNTLGRFCRERQYSDLLTQKLAEKGFHFTRELPVLMAGRKSNFVDFVVESKLLIEVKAKPFVGKEEYFQVMRYLEAVDLELGLIVNFQNKYLKPQRVLNPKYSKRKTHWNNSSDILSSGGFGYSHSAYLGVDSDILGRHKVFVGGTRVLKLKNVPMLRRAFALAKARRPEIELDLQPAPHRQFLEKIKSAYAVILASLGDISPNMILEAIRRGKPFILTRETGLYEKLKDIGVWVNPEDTDDIAAKIEWLADEKNYEMQCKKVAAFVFTHSFEEIAKEIIAVYRAL